MSNSSAIKYLNISSVADMQAKRVINSSLGRQKNERLSLVPLMAKHKRSCHTHDIELSRN